MGKLDAGNSDIIKENAELIHRTVLAVAAPEYIPELEKILVQAESNDWGDLVKAIRKILEGERDLSQLTGLDDEDRAIVSAILQGIEDSTSLPDLTSVIDPAVAGPSMANMIHDAAAGNADAIGAIKSVSQQMSSASGEFSKIPNAINLMVTGERQADILCADVGAAGTILIQAILDGLKDLEA